MHTLTSRLVAAMATIALALSASTASACPIAPGFVPPPNRTGLHWGIAIASVAVVDATTIGGQLALHEELFPDWLAGLELALGVAQTVGTAVLVMNTTTSSTFVCDTDPWQHYATWSAPALGLLGGWLIAHAIWSLSVAEPPEVRASVAVSPDGAQLVVVGTF